MGLFNKLNTPNKLTLCRMIGVIFIVIIGVIDFYFKKQLTIYNSNNVSFTWTRIIILVLFLGCSYTDHLDGKIARKNNQITTFGKFADPIADKSLNNSLFIILAVNHELTLLVPLIFVLRDTIVDGIRIIAAQKNKVLAASFFGKLKTVIQVVLAAYYLICYPLFNAVLVLKVIGIILCVIAIITSLGSGIEYLKNNKDMLLEGAK